MSIRNAIKKEIKLLSSPTLQLEYERNVPIANVPAELICSYCDDLYHPQSEQMQSQFNQEELKDLKNLYSVISDAAEIEASSVKELQESKQWQTVIKTAKELDAYYSKNA